MKEYTVIVAGGSFTVKAESKEDALTKINPDELPWVIDVIGSRENTATHHTFPNGAVQGGAFTTPGQLEAKLKELGIADLTPEERYANLLAAFGEIE